MKICIRLGIIILILLTGLYANKVDPLYNSVESHLSKYRQTIYNDDISMKNGIIRLELNGRRTNIKSQFLLGFYSVGRALHWTNMSCREIQIIIHYKMKIRNQISARAPADKVMDLSQGRLSTEQFFALIGY